MFVIRMAVDTVPTIWYIRRWYVSVSARLREKADLLVPILAANGRNDENRRIFIAT
jgi:hypothetical protein